MALLLQCCRELLAVRHVRDFSEPQEQEHLLRRLRRPVPADSDLSHSVLSVTEATTAVLLNSEIHNRSVCHSEALPDHGIPQRRDVQDLQSAAEREVLR